MTPTTLLLATALGAVLGLLHFGGLWLTVRRLPGSRHPHLLWAGSLALRLALLSACLVPVARSGLGPLAVCLTTLLAVRQTLTRRLAPRQQGREGGGIP